jgi:methionyl-tRNA synthetase
MIAAAAGQPMRLPMTQKTTPRRIFVTTALPYANGDLHAGHLLEYLQADIWVRAQRMQGHGVQFVCADDAHGAPIMLAAQKAGLDPEEYVTRVTAGRRAFLEGFGIAFDHWYTTHSEENTVLAHQIFAQLKSRGLITSRTVSQFHDPVRNMFLPDRYIQGTCPRCRAPGQYGDGCEACGAFYAPTDLIEPRSVLSNVAPQLRDSEHLFVTLSSSQVSAFLQEWVTSGALQSEVLNKTREWLEAGLRDWDISRDAPYFGIDIPGWPDKYFYVWLDAPVGYLASLQHHFESGGARSHPHGPSRTSLSFEDYLQAPDLEQVHFIGKDIVYFHTLFWPVMLAFSGRRPPTRIHVHGHLLINGQKMSKSRGNGIDPMRYLAGGLDPDWLRYYLAAKLTSRVEDVDFQEADFTARVNADLVGKFVNIASRSAGFLSDRFAGRLGNLDADGAALVAGIQAWVPTLAALYEAADDARVVRETMGFADRVNEYYDRGQPWVLARSEDGLEPLQAVCSACVEAFRLLALALKPIVPGLIARAEAFLQCPPLGFADADRLLGQGHVIARYTHLTSRVSPQALRQAVGSVSPD